MNFIIVNYYCKHFLEINVLINFLEETSSLIEQLNTFVAVYPSHLQNCYS